jgi:KaiC/GvpD/RAD55 family RecA-like ATPase
MSIKVSYRRVSPEKFIELQNHPELAQEFFYGEDSATTDLLDRLMQAQFQNNRELAQQLSGQVKEVLYRDKASVYADNLNTTKTQLSVEKEWQAIHYLLTGEVAFDESQAESPLRKLILGGTSTEFEATYGYVRYLSPTEVKELAQALRQVSREDLRARFDARENLEIYAQKDEWAEEDWELLLRVLDCIIRFFNEAATDDQLILISSN